MGAVHGVNPFIFATLYFITVPAFWFSIGWIVRNLKHGKSLWWPVLLTALSQGACYIYMFTVGENLPVWVYGLAFFLISVAGIQTWRKVNLKLKTADENVRL